MYDVYDVKTDNIHVNEVFHVKGGLYSVCYVKGDTT